MIINVLLGVAVAGFIVEDLFVLAALYHEQKLKDYREGAHADYWMIIVSVPFIVMAAAMVAFYILLTVSNDMKMYTELTATLIGCALMIPAAWLIVDLLRFRASDQVTNR
ncbi:MAG: hypothetical protein SGI88_03040 [Candidatus Hydrogenedentes bacterium]|nr:hypothetical protein [Candidatus Hydrogenedentota bacterium]